MAMFGIKNRDLLELAEKAMRDGWKIDKTSGDRLKWIVPGGGACVFTSINITHPRAVKNIRSEMRYALTKAAANAPSAPTIALPKPNPLKVTLGETIHLSIPPKETKPMQSALPIVPAEIISSTPRKDVPAVPAAPALRERPIIQSMEAIDLVKQEIDINGTWPPKAAEMIFAEFKVRTHKSRNNADEGRFYESANSLLGALTKKYPKYLLRNMKQGPMKVLQVRDTLAPPMAAPVPTDYIKVPIPEAILKVDSSIDLATQVKYLMATPGVSDEKRQSLLRVLLGA